MNDSRGLPEVPVAKESLNLALARAGNKFFIHILHAVSPAGDCDPPIAIRQRLETVCSR